MGILRRTQSMRAEVDEQSYARRSRAEAAGSTAPPRQAGVARRAIQTPCALRGQAPAGPRLAASASGTTSPSSVSPQSLDPPRQHGRIGGRRRRGRERLTSDRSLGWLLATGPLPLPNILLVFLLINFHF
jgi:hypothetical protein